MVVGVTLDAGRVDKYLARLGFDAAPGCDAAGLIALHRAHLRAVPFENLDIHLGVPIVLDTIRLVDKLVVARRGGFCYELNGAFGALLDALGFGVDHLEARVYDGDDVGIRFDHLCLRVTVDGGTTYLVDVGFGACFDEPLRFAVDVEQQDPAGRFVVASRSDGWLDLVHDGTPQYRFSPAPRRLADFAGGCRYHQESPDSHFTRSPVCSLRTASGRVTLSGRRLVETHGDARAERDLDPGEVAHAYRSRFGIDLAADALHLLAR
jgi:N-hydroxyarylamine O-acetyltransferase